MYMYIHIIGSTSIYIYIHKQGTGTWRMGSSWDQGLVLSIFVPYIYIHKHIYTYTSAGSCGSIDGANRNAVVAQWTWTSWDWSISRTYEGKLFNFVDTCQYVSCTFDTDRVSRSLSWFWSQSHFNAMWLMFWHQYTCLVAIYIYYYASRSSSDKTQCQMLDTQRLNVICHIYIYIYVFIYMYIIYIYNRYLTYCRFFIIGRLARHTKLLPGMIDAVCLACTFVWTWMEIIVSTTLHDMLGRVAFLLCIEPTFIWRALRRQLKKNVQHYRHVFMSCHLNYIYTCFWTCRWR